MYISFISPKKMLRTFDKLPEEIVINILQYLSFQDLCQVQLVSRKWRIYQISQRTQNQTFIHRAIDNIFWKDIYLRIASNPIYQSIAKEIKLEKENPKCYKIAISELYQKFIDSKLKQIYALTKVDGMYIGKDQLLKLKYVPPKRKQADRLKFVVLGTLISFNFY